MSDSEYSIKFHREYTTVIHTPREQLLNSPNFRICLKRHRLLQEDHLVGAHKD